MKTSEDWKNEMWIICHDMIEHDILILPSKIPWAINNPNCRSTGRFPVNLPSGVSEPKPVSSEMIPSWTKSKSEKHNRVRNGKVK